MFRHSRVGLCWQHNRLLIARLSTEARINRLTMMVTRRSLRLEFNVLFAFQKLRHNRLVLNLNHLISLRTDDFALMSKSSRVASKLMFT